MAVDKNKKKALDAEITDALLDDFDKFEHFAVNNWKRIALFAVAVVIGVALWVTIAEYRTKAERKANDAICNAKTEAEIIKVVQEYAGYPAANYARLRLAKMYLGQKQYAKAYEQFKLLRASDIPREMAWRINLDEAYSLELEGKKTEAAAKFSGIGSDPSLPEGFRCEANYGAGRLYCSLKQFDKARKYLTKASSVKQGMYNQAAGLWVSQAKFMLIRLPEPSGAAPVKAPPTTAAAKVVPIKKAKPGK